MISVGLLTRIDQGSLTYGRGAPILRPMSKRARPLMQRDFDFINSRIDANEKRIADMPKVLTSHEYKCDACNRLMMSTICWVEPACGPGCWGIPRPTGRTVEPAPK